MTANGYWSVVVPEVGQNLCNNPSLELATTGWAAMAGSIARSTTRQRRGAYSLACTPTSATGDGCYFATITLANGTSYTATVDFWGVLGVTYHIYFASTVPATLGTPTTFTGTGDWQRVTVTWAENVGAARRIYITKNAHASTGVFYVDGVDVEAKAYETTYLDGDQAGCVWDGTPQASTSTRDAQSRSGGREINLTGSYEALVEEWPGTGMLVPRNVSTPYALSDGEQFQRVNFGARTFILTILALGTSWVNLHSIRQSLINAFKPDLVKGQQACQLRYTGNTRKQLINCFYDGGLEFSQPNGFSDKIVMRFVAYDPHWQEDGDDGAALTVQQTITSSTEGHAITRSEAGLWADTGNVNSGNVNCVTRGPDGYIYVGGQFTSMGGVANTERLARWTGTAWESVTTGNDIPSGEIFAIEFTPNGDMYIAGSFGALTSVADSSYAAKRSAAGVWTGLNAGPFFDAGIRCLAALPAEGSINPGKTYIIFAGGHLHNSASAQRVAVWNGSVWANLVSTTGSSKPVYSMAIDRAGTTLYVAGEFATIGGIANTAYVAKSTDGTNFTAMGAGVSGGSNAYAVAIGPDGLVYVGGQFTAMDSKSNTARIAVWNGTAWAAVGSGFSAGLIRGMGFDPQGNLWVVGYGLTSTGGFTLYSAGSMAIWNGSTWLAGEIEIDNAGDTRKVLITPSGMVWLTHAVSTAANYVSAAVTTLTNNGSAKTYPKFRITGPGKLWSIINYTTGEALRFAYQLNTSEVVILDLTPGKRSMMSNLFGNVIHALQPASNMGQWGLLPGGNSISVLIDNSSATMSAWWPRRHWSLDGAG